MGSGFNFGVDAQEIVLILMAFASQHEIFEMLYATSDLAFVALTFGLIGFVSLLMLPANWTPTVVAPWLFLMIIIMARPLGETLFFTDPIKTTRNIINQPLCPGDVVDQDQCKKIVGETGTSYTIGRRANFGNEGGIDEVSSSFMMFTPLAATVHVVNTLHLALIKDLQGLGGRSINKHITAIETVRRSATADMNATYAIANFQATCGAKGLGFEEYALTPQGSLMRNENFEKIRNSMERERLTALDGLLMFDNFVNFSSRGDSFAPPLICNEGSQGICENNNYDLMLPRTRVLPDIEKTFGGNSILFSSDADYQRIMYKPDGSADSNPDSGDDSDQREYSGVEEAKINLEEQGLASLEDADDLRGQPVSILVPTNTRAVLESRYGELDDLAMDLDELAAEIDNVYRDMYVNIKAVAVGTMAGGVILGVGALLGAACTAATFGGCAIVIAAALGGGFYAHQTSTVHFAEEKKAKLQQQVADVSGRGLVMRVDDCFDLYQATQTMITTANSNFTFLRGELTEFLEENEDLIAAKGGNVMGLPPRERMDILLRTALERDKLVCDESNGGVFGTEKGCIETAEEEFSQLIALLRQESANQSSAASAALIDKSMQPVFGRPGFELASKFGEVAGPIGIWFKTILGGFGAGTYSAIMPTLVSYATALAIMLTPLLFMIGLAVPTWSLGVILLPIIIVAYFQLTKVIFSMIGIIASVFVAGRSAGLITGFTSGFSDLVMATAYTSAFLLTGILMFALKNPFGAVQKVAGGADQASTISGQQALQMAAVAYGGAKTIGTVARNAEEKTGQASAAVEAHTGLDTSSVLPTERTRLARGQSLQSRAERAAKAEHYSNMNAEDFNQRASGQLAQSKEKEAMEIAHAAGNDHIYDKAPKGYRRTPEGDMVEVDKLRNAFKSLGNAIKEAGMEFTDEQKKAVVGADKLGGKHNDKIYRQSGAVAYDYNAEALKGSGVNVKELVANNDNVVLDKVTDKKGNTSEVVRVIEHPGPGSGGSGGGKSGSDIKDRIRSSADRNKPNRPKGGSDKS